jgi:glutamate-1-semialdehyde 2,1-aminomutase
MSGDSQSHTTELRRRAERVLVGGVNSPVRAFRAVSGEPIFIERAEGARLWDADGRELLDFIGSWGAMILGHAHPAVSVAIADQARRGASYGVTSPLEVELAEEICHAMPSIEKIRFVSSGTEAVMSAVRVARAFTGRELVLKFDGCYHGHSDGFLSHAGSGLATLGMASSPGVPEAFARLTLHAAYNDLTAAENIFATHRGEIAAIIVEPVAANMGIVPPETGFLDGLRNFTQREGALLVFDEVITGFRVAYGGAQSLYGIEPDLTVLGKIIGGGLPVGAYGGRREVMDLVAPAGPVYQAGTLSGNPLAMRAGLATLREIQRPGFYDELNRKSARLASGLRDVVSQSGLPMTVNAIGSLITLFFAAPPVCNYDDAKRADTAEFGAFFQEMLRHNILLPPSQFEAWFFSSAHTDGDIDRAIAAVRESSHDFATRSGGMGLK